MHRLHTYRKKNSLCGNSTKRFLPETQLKACSYRANLNISNANRLFKGVCTTYLG